MSHDTDAHSAAGSATTIDLATGRDAITDLGSLVEPEFESSAAGAWPAFMRRYIRLGRDAPAHEQ